MSGTLLIAPHADDESLFAAYVCQRDRPLVICCFDQGRSLEFTYACAALGCSSVTFADADLEEHLSLYRTAEVVWAPALHAAGHEDHNAISEGVTMLFGSTRVRYYSTYAPRGQRQQGVEVMPEPWMIAGKLRAMACYQSQIAEPSTRPWFYDLLDMREWTA